MVRHTEHSKHGKDVYGAPGGKCREGEAEIETARRELEEETGLRCNIADLIPIPSGWRSTVTYKDGRSHDFTHQTFLCKRWSGELRGTEEEIPEWIPIEKVATLPLLPNALRAVEEALKMRR